MPTPPPMPSSIQRARSGSPAASSTCADRLTVVADHQPSTPATDSLAQVARPTALRRSLWATDSARIDRTSASRVGLPDWQATSSASSPKTIASSMRPIRPLSWVSAIKHVGQHAAAGQRAGQDQRPAGVPVGLGVPVHERLGPGQPGQRGQVAGGVGVAQPVGRPAGRPRWPPRPGRVRPRRRWRRRAASARPTPPRGSPRRRGAVAISVIAVGTSPRCSRRVAISRCSQAPPPPPRPR